MARFNEQRAIDDIRLLALDMINEAGSGHPGVALGAAPTLYTLFMKHMNYDLERKNWIVYIGRMHYEKGVDRLINAVARIRNFQDWKLVLVGAGLHLDDFKQLAFRLGVTDRVNFVGVSNNVERYLFQSKIFAFPSRGEGFPNALLEAMASGLACVSFDCVAGPRDIIQDHKNGLLIENGDIDAFTKAIELLMSDENLRLAISKEAMLVKQKYSLEKIGDMYYNFLTRNLR